MNLKKIEAIAIKIRKEFRNFRIDEKELKRIYQDYNTLGNPDLFLSSSKQIFPNLNCGLTTVYLRNLLGGEIINGKYKDNNHTFLILRKKIIIDITADQYKGPEVYVGPIRKPWAI